MNSAGGVQVGHFHGFDALRVAVAVVVLIENAAYVATGGSVINVLRLADFALLGAKVGVELLIMLSGFLLIRDLMRPEVGPLRVLSRRLVGLVPLLVATAAVSGWLYPETRVSALLTLSYNFETAKLDTVGPLLPWWTIFVILHLAILWCVLARLGVGTKGFTRLAITWLVAATALGIALDISDPARWMEWNYKSTLTRGVGWCVGVLVAIHGVPRLPAHIGKIAIGAWALAVVLYVAVNQMRPGVAPWHLIQTLLTVSAFVILVRAISEPGERSRVWHWASGYSFSLYIVQAPVIWWFARGEDSVPSMGVYLTMIASCLIVAIVAEHAIVRPLCRLKPGARTLESAKPPVPLKSENNPY